MTTFESAALPSIAPAPQLAEAQPMQLATSPQTAGWFDDPEGRHHLRYFDGDGWTTHVTHFGPSPCVACRVNDA